ncbi:MAG: Crp/Fnr family transcriptional regulator [Bacteroidetes bacterium]|nr:Crp/Fnr family transcriptional regulator [Bacteroidota bacterium]
MQYKELLKKQLNSICAIDDNAVDALSEPWVEVRFGRKQLITKSGEVEKYLYLVIDGVQRAFFEYQDKEPTIVFSYTPSFSGIIDSFFTQTPSRFNLEAITSSTLLRIHYNELQELMNKHRSIETWVRHALSYVLKGTLERQAELMAYSAEEKFTTLLRRSPHVLNLIPHKYLASYIGLDPATFSKLLGSIKI